MRRSALLLLLLPLLACAEEQKPPSDKVTAPRGPSASVLFPLAVGNHWSYRVSFLGAAQDLTVSIVAEEDGAFRDSRGQRFRIGSGGLRDEQRYLLREPLALGKKWSAVIDITHSEYYRVSEVGESVVVPAGHFEGCVRVEASTPETPAHILIAEQTYCPHVGLVRVVTYAELDGRRGPPQVKQELTSYRVQP
jgi:hypothetical protein